MTTDTTERGLEQRICALLTHRADAPDAADVRERPATYEAGWLNGHSADYDREHCIDLAQLTAFLKTTQPRLAAALALDADSPTRRKFLARLKNEVGKRGIVEVLRNGVKHGPHAIALLYGTPSPGNPQAAALYEQNRFSVTRQLSYSNANKRLTLDLALFINGLPVATFELKNSLTKQTAADAVEQYKRDATPKRSSSASVAAWSTSPWMTSKCCSVRTSTARRRGSCRSTRAGTTAPVTRPTPTASRPIICGATC